MSEKDDSGSVPPELDKMDEHVVIESQDGPQHSGEQGAGSRTEESIKRSRKPTERGEQYQKQLIEQLVAKSKKRLENQFKAIENLLDRTTDVATLENENCTLDKLFSNLLEAVARKRESMKEDDDQANLDKMIHDLDEKHFKLKQCISEIVRKHIQDTKIKHVPSEGSVISRASVHSRRSAESHVSRSSVKQQIADLEAERQDMIRAQESEIQAEFPKDASCNGSVVSSHTSTHSKRSTESHVSRSSIKKQALIAGLEAERQAMIRAQEAEIQAEVLKTEEESKLAVQLKASKQKTDLFKMEEKIAKVKAMEAIYREEEMRQETFAAHDLGSKSSNASTSSRVSNRSSIAKRAELAGLRAEIEAKKVTQQVEIETEQLKAQAEARSARNMKDLTQRLELLDLEKRIAKEKAIGNVLKQSAKSKQKQHHDNGDQVESILEPQNKHFIKHDDFNSNIPKAPNNLPPPETEFPHKGQTRQNRMTEKFISQSANTLTTQLSRLIKQQAAPDVEIDTFSGDALEYTYFITNFKEIVESSVDSQTGRLNRLIKYTAGEAKELIKHCVHEPTVDCYDKALDLLNREYGNKFKISCAYMEELRRWPQVKQNEANAFKKFYRFLLRCLTIQKRGELDVLNSPMSIRQLQLKLPTPQQDKWSKIVETTRRHKGREANFEDFVKFIDFETSVISDPVYSRSGGSEKKPINVNNTTVKSDTTPESKEQILEPKAADKQVRFEKCIVCQKAHELERCEIFIKKSIEEKKVILYEHRLCYACYGKGHIAMGCTNRKTCTICKKSHPTSMHVKVNSFGVEQNGVIAMCILPVIVYHRDQPEKSVKVYAVIDNCSQGTFATEDLLLNDLGVEGRQTSITLETAIGQETVQTFSVDNLCVRCTDEHKELYPDSPEIKLPSTFTRSTLPADTRDIASKGKALQWEHLKEAATNMAEYDENLPISLLIGLNCPRAQEPYESVRGKENAPYAVRNALGWCIMGPVNNYAKGHVKCNRIRLQFPSTDVAQNNISKHHFAVTETVKDNFAKNCLQEMWMTDFSENNSEEQAMSLEDRRFVDIMSNEVDMKDGKYELPLPFRSSNPQMPESRQQARSRLKSIKRRLQSNSQFHEDYTTFMQDIIDKGYAKMCTNDNGSWYIPHHGVYHPHKSKIRVVFDCSAQNAGVSLNSELLQGPDLTNSLLGVLMRFRLERTAIIADIESMFYQVKVPEHQRKYIRFLWWPDGNLEGGHKEYEMCAHLFGALSSPSCANFALRQTAADNELEYGRETANVLRNDFYVDDLLKSIEDEDEAVSMIDNVQKICNSGGFNLTKFISNSKKVIESLPSSKLSKSMENLDILEPKWPIERALGVRWCIESDSFQFRINLADTPLTRRGILSSISSIYDPLGLVAPFLLKGRKILQEITSESSKWDDNVREEHVQEWDQWRRGLPALETLKVPRCYKPDDFGSSVYSSLHCFSDASKIGYGVGCYLRQINEQERIHVSLVVGKSRVSPLKSITIPRLELTAATVAAKVAHMVKKQISIENITEFYWTDSQIVLGYIYNEARRFRIFVANRVQQIRDYTNKNQWRYIETERNPSDAASRGLTVDDKEKVQSWFNGPRFLWDKDDEWKIKIPNTMVNGDDPEAQSITHINVIAMDPEEYLLDTILGRISNWHKMKRVLATMISFARKCQKQEDPNPYLVENVESAGKLLVKMAQQQNLKDELKRMDTFTSNLKKEPKWFSRLDPFKDDDGILRVGGRLRNSEQSCEIKFPMILPREGLLTRRIIEWFHMKVGHSGRSTTANEIRSNGFWIIGMTMLVKSIIFSCVRCRLLRGKMGQQKMADLPLERTLEVAPFSYCGVDMFGPFQIKEGRKIYKRYCALFTCFSSRAVHLETTNKIDTDSFILALRRFLSTRGRVRTIRSDNGGNFVGADNEFKKAWKEMDQTKIGNFLQTEMCDWIDWEKNTPNASHMGGVWERQIRTVRGILSSLLKSHDQVLNDESFNTLIKEVECIINSRPLSVEDVDDPSSEVLTPNHLLTLKSKAVLPPPGVFQKNDTYCRKRWRVIQHLANEFWCRWRKEYLSNLQARQKWTKQRRNFCIGDIVLLKEENVPRNSWPIARIVETFPNKDGLIRSVNLKIAVSGSDGKTTNLKRPITKLVLLLETEDADQ